jgi:1-phosphatidylinositol phosphodiesterase
MRLQRATIVNHCAQDISRLVVEDARLEPIAIDEAARTAPRAEVLVRSRRHGTKRLPVHGNPRSAHWRIALHLEREHEPIVVEIDRESAKQSHPLALKRRPGQKHRALLWALADTIILSVYDETDAVSWMKDLDDALQLSEMDMPGTHDSCARFGGVAYECQSMTIAEQLDAGIRFFDIRCRHYQDAFPIHHDAYYQNQDFGPDVVDVCLAFLQKHPRECIVMSVKNEYNETDNTQTYQQTFDAYIQNSRSSWYLGDTIPTLGEVRGKIVLIRRFQADSVPLGIDASPWADNATFAVSNAASLRIQDNYDVPTLCNIDDKWDQVRSLLDDARSGSRDDWYFNFCSGAVGASPENIAKGTPGIRGINDFLLQYLLENPTGRLGVIGMDFPEYPLNNALTTEIIAHNSR